MTPANQTIQCHALSDKTMNNRGMFSETTGEFNNIVQSYSSILFATVIHLTKDRQTTEDIVQETFLKLWEKRVEIRTDNIGGWLYKVACNLAYKHLRRETSKARIYASLQVEKQSFYTDVEERLLQKENRSFVAEAYNRLPEKQQAVYLLSNEEGLTRDEIADHLNISPNTVKNHLARAIQFLRENIRCACLFFLLFVFSVFNNNFFTASSTKVDLRDLYNIQQRKNINPATETNNRYPYSYSTSFIETINLKPGSIRSI